MKKLNDVRELKTMDANSYILYETRTVAAIATGFKQASSNLKTGAMIQIWIIRHDRHPSEAINDGSDKAICFNCPLRRNAEGRACYVRMDSVASIWRKYAAGGYRRLAVSEYETAFAGRMVRFGAYGEPVLLPFDMVSAIASASAGWSGYTHQWHNPLFAAYKRFFMASCSAHDYEEAQTAGWRTFTVSAEHLPDQIVCPASAERGHKLQCKDCKLCAGVSRQARNIQIRPHGPGQRYAA